MVSSRFISLAMHSWILICLRCIQIVDSGWFQAGLVDSQMLLHYWWMLVALSQPSLSRRPTIDSKLPRGMDQPWVSSFRVSLFSPAVFELQRIVVPCCPQLVTPRNRITRDPDRAELQMISACAKWWIVGSKCTCRAVPSIPTWAKATVSKCFMLVTVVGK